MKKNYLFTRLAIALPFILFLNACKKDGLSNEDKTHSKTIAASSTIQKNKLSITKVAGVVNPIDIDFDYDGKLYILTKTCVKTIDNGELKTLAVPDTLFSDFVTYDGFNYGPIKHITAGRDGSIYVAGDNGIRVVFATEGYSTYVYGDIGWGIAGLRDLAITPNDELYYGGGAEAIVRAVPENPLISQGLYGFGHDGGGYVSVMDCVDDNIAWLGTSIGIGSILLPPRPDYTEGWEFKINYIGNPDGKKSEGPIGKVKLGNISQIEATDDGSIIYFIEAGNLKQLKNGWVKVIAPMANETSIALSKDASKLYFIANGELNVLALD